MIAASYLKPAGAVAVAKFLDIATFNKHFQIAVYSTQTNIVHLLTGLVIYPVRRRMARSALENLKYQVSSFGTPYTRIQLMIIITETRWIVKQRKRRRGAADSLLVLRPCKVSALRSRVTLRVVAQRLEQLEDFKRRYK